MNQNYLMINKATNTVVNVCVWDGNTNTWAPPSGTLMLVQSTTPAMIWAYSDAAQDYVLTEVVGQGQIGFTWNGAACVTNTAKPTKPLQS